MKHLVKALLASGVAVVSLSACPQPSGCDGGTCGDGSVSYPEDLCNSKSEAQANATCKLELGVAREAYVSTLPDGGADLDYYLVELPATVNGRTLLHVRAGYPSSVPQTAVNFQVNVTELESNSVVATGTDRHGTAAPKPVDVVVPYTTPGARLLVTVGDVGGLNVPRVDNRNKYSVLVEVTENPDVNEPNDSAATATAIPLQDAAGGKLGTQSGYLATNDDVDLYTFTVSDVTRKVLYLHLTGPRGLESPPPYRLSYVLSDPSGVRLSEGDMPNEFLDIDLATARRLPAAGTYTLAVKGYKPSTAIDPIPGDLAVRYELKLLVLQDRDTYEPNETVATAARRAGLPSLGETWTLQGRLSAVPDDDWYAIELPAQARDSVLRYRLTVGSGTSAFDAPTSITPYRHLLLLGSVPVTGSVDAAREACKTSQSTCPRSFDSRDSQRRGQLESYCNAADGPHCLLAERGEDTEFAALKNLRGSIGVPGHTGTVTYYLRVNDPGAGLDKYADDELYTLTLTWEADPDDTFPTGPLGVGQTRTVSGTLAYGYGMTSDFDITRGAGIRAPADYDAVPTDTDTFFFNVDPGADLSWNLSWTLDHASSGGAPPGELSLDFVFCGVSDGGALACTPERRIKYTADRITPWYLPPSYYNAGTLFERTASSGSSSYRWLDVGCWCLAQSFAAAGSYQVKLGALNRVSDEPLRYQLTQTMGAYPSSYAAPDGGAATSCPGPGEDAGCRFGM